MTEKEAWLRIAEMFESGGPTWKWYATSPTIVGICQATAKLRSDFLIDWWMKDAMNARLAEHFNPNGKDPVFEFFWPENLRRTSRDLRATACCFLAAMCDD